MGLRNILNTRGWSISVVPGEGIVAQGNDICQCSSASLTCSAAHTLMEELGDGGEEGDKLEHAGVGDDGISECLG